MLAYKGMPTVCPVHGGGVIDSPDRGVLVGGAGLHAAASGDACDCPGAPNVILAGATDILVKGLPASGWLHVTAHNPGPPDAPTAAVIWGSTNVLMGGGMTVGPVGPATAACMLLAADRQGMSLKPDKANQSGQNCGVESMRQIINAKLRREGKGPLTEDALLDDALENGDSYVTNSTADKWDATIVQKDKEMEPYRRRFEAARKAYEGSKGVFGYDEKLHQDYLKEKREYEAASDRILVDPHSGASLGADADIKAQAVGARERQRQRALSAKGTHDYKDPNRYWAGGTLPDQQRRMLDRHGVETTELAQDGTSEEAMKALEDKVARGHGVIVGTKAAVLWNDAKAEGDHAVLVTAVEYGEDGQVTGYVTNDTARGCGRRVTRAQLRGALRSDLKATVTKDPIW
jgi:uncharacterized Zn-binding protein involved in type VI secretion